ncbi:hypothetical protein [Alloactinosynnema sp. L-07]|uniref:hypothetical protein n=1 Tax=Alloactinosynnema sp. L-07 TaxID=1653480 RepID=UPI0015617AB0
MTVLGMREEMGHQRRRNWLPADRLALLMQTYQALLCVEVAWCPQSESTTTSRRRLGVEPKQQSVELWIVASRGRGVVNLD